MGLKLYEYKNCSTCRKARAYLDAREVAYCRIPIRETPPTKTELKKMLQVMEGKTGHLFNTSGRDYRALKLKDKLPDLTEPEILDLLASNGNLIKRPFLIGNGVGTVGFNAKAWDNLPLAG